MSSYKPVAISEPHEVNMFNRKSYDLKPKTEEKISDSETGPAEGQDPFFKFKFLKQLALIFVWICLGLYLEIMGPTLPDLKDRLGVDYERVSQALIFTSVGVMTGSPLVGYLHERFYAYTELLVALGLLIGGVACIILPYVGTVPLVALCFYIFGFTEALINIGGNTIVMHMWEDKAPAPMHSLHFGFGVGAFIGPQIAKPFLAPRNNPSVNNVTHSNTSLEIMNVTTATPLVSQSRFEYAFLIGGLVVIMCSFLWVGIFCQGFPKDFPRRKGSKLSKKMFSPASCAGGHMMFGILLFLFLFIYFMQAAGGQRCYGRFIFSFLIESSLKFTETEAANLNSVFWGSFTLGRMTGIPIASFLSTPKMIAYQGCGLVVTCVILAIFVFKSKLVIWILTVPLGYFMAQTYPSGMAWSNIYLSMNSIGVMFLTLGASTGGLIYQYLPGYLLENYGQSTFLYIMVMYAGCLLFAFIVMQFIARLFTNRYTQRDEVELEVRNFTPSK